MTANREIGIGAEAVQLIVSNWSSGQAVSSEPRARAQSPATMRFLGDQRVSFNLSSANHAGNVQGSTTARKS
jgi:hypothetical protein